MVNGDHCNGFSGTIKAVMQQKRELFRIALERSGEIHQGAIVARCEVLDLTEKGVQLKTDLSVTVGEALQLEFNLTKSCAIHCSLLVTRVSPPHVGACITDIFPEDQKHLSSFVEQLITLNLGGF